MWAQRKRITIRGSPPSSHLPRTFFYKAWNYSVAKTLQDQYQSNRLGNGKCPFQLDVAKWFHSYISIPEPTINVRKILPSTKTRNVVQNVASFLGVTIHMQTPPPIFKRNVKAFSLSAIVDVRRRHEMIFLISRKLLELVTSKFITM